MAIPADVISGETIESEWGNTIRDFACFGIDFGGAQENTTDSTLTTTYENGASTTFTKPADWTDYKIMAWGSVLFMSTAATFAKARLDIGGNFGSEIVGPSTSATVPDAHSINVRHQRTGITGNLTISIQYGALSSGLQKTGSALNFIAIRTG